MSKEQTEDLLKFLNPFTCEILDFLKQIATLELEIPATTSCYD